MASLNISSNGPSILKSYQSVVISPALAGSAAASSFTYSQWALFTVSTPLVNAFQPDAGGKESILKVQSTGEGELIDLIEEFSEGKIQFAFIKIKDPNTNLPKNVLISWCGEGVPDRTKGYFTSHLTAVSKFLHGYHVQITARSDGDLTPEGILQKVAVASGAKYSPEAIISSGSTPLKPPVATKPVFTAVRSGGLLSKPVTNYRRTTTPKDDTLDEDGWGPDAPPVTRTQLEKVPSAYRPTKVNLQQLTSQRPGESNTGSVQSDNDAQSDVVKGGYQPVGKVDISALRRQAQEAGTQIVGRPEPVKGAYEPVGKVDIAAIRAKAHRSFESHSSSAEDVQRLSEPKPLPGHSAAFQTSGRLTTIPKPKVSNRLTGVSTFTGTKTSFPGEPGAQVSAAGLIGTASRKFADEGGKTPAQLWAERKAKERDSSSTRDVLTSRSSDQPQLNDGEWRSSYTGRTWAPVQTSHTGLSTGSGATQHSTGHSELSLDPESKASTGAVSCVRGQFGNETSNVEEDIPSPPPLDNRSKPNAGRGIPMPGLPSGPVASDDTFESKTKQDVPTPPPQPRSPTPLTPSIRGSSPIHVAMPVSRNAPEDSLQGAHQEQFSPPQALPIHSLEQAVQPEDKLEDFIYDTARATTEATVHATLASNSIRAVVQYDYEQAEENEIELKEGEYVTEIEMVDQDWWLGVNSRGEQGLFPSNYVEIIEAGNMSQQSDPGIHVHESHDAEIPGPVESSTIQAAGLDPATKGHTAIALYDYEAAEDNELSFPDGAKIINIEFPDEDWWSGEYGGKIGLFPANYVHLDE